VNSMHCINSLLLKTAKVKAYKSACLVLSNTALSFQVCRPSLPNTDKKLTQHGKKCHVFLKPINVNSSFSILCPMIIFFFKNRCFSEL
jgi:hypothetical protein